MQFILTSFLTCCYAPTSFSHVKSKRPSTPRERGSRFGGRLLTVRRPSFAAISLHIRSLPGFLPAAAPEAVRL